MAGNFVKVAGGATQIVEKGLRHDCELLAAGMYRVPLSLNWKMLDIERRELARRRIQRQGMS